MRRFALASLLLLALTLAVACGDDGAASDFFGHSVAISGATAIVGADLNDDNGDSSGSAYLFDTTTGRQIAKLLPNDGAAFDFFGISVAISGATAIVGAYQDDDNGSASGSAYLFDTSTGQQIAKLVPDDGATGDFFGWYVAISGDTAIVGAWRAGHEGVFSGAGYLFDVTTGRQIAKLVPNDGTNGDQFGRSVAISGNTAMAGAWFDDDNGTDSGSAYLFDAGASSPGDMNCDGQIDALDIEGFLLALFDPDEYAIRYPECDINNADINGDGAIDALDIEGFLNLLFP